MWILVSLAFIAIAFGIYSMIQKKKAETDLKNAINTIPGSNTGTTGSSNIWTLISGLSGLFGEFKSNKKTVESETDLSELPVSVIPKWL